MTESTIDVLEELDGIAADAQRALDRIAAGTAVNGLGALARIRDRAEDAARHVRADAGEGPRVTGRPTRWGPTITAALEAEAQRR